MPEQASKVNIEEPPSQVTIEDPSPSPKMEKPPSGFTNEFFRRTLGVSGPMEVGRNIGSTSKWWYDSVIGHDPVAASKLGEGVKLYVNAIRDGVRQLWKEIGDPKAGHEAMGAVTGIGDISAAKEFAQKKEYGAALGATAAAGAKILPLFPKIGKGVAAGKIAARTEELASGERIPVTRGMIHPEGTLARMEPVLSGLPGGSPLRKVYKSVFEEGQGFLNRATREATEATTGRPQVLPKNIADAAEVSSRIIRDEAGPLYQNVESSMGQPSASVINWTPLSIEAKSLLHNDEVASFVSRSDLNPTLKTDLEKLVTAGGGTLSPYESYKAATSARSKLYDLINGPLKDSRMAPYRRVAYDLRNKLTSAIENSLRGTRPDLADTWRSANRMTAQGHAMKEISETLRDALQGSTEESQAGFKKVDVKAQKVRTGKLVEALKELSHTEVPSAGRTAGKSTIQRAYPRATDVETIQQVAELMDRAAESGGMAGKMGVLGMVRGLGHTALGAGAGLVIGGAHGAETAATAVVAAELGSWALSKVMATPGAGRVLVEYMKAVPGSGKEISLAARLNTLIDKNSMNPPMESPPSGSPTGKLEPPPK